MVLKKMKKIKRGIQIISLVSVLSLLCPTQILAASFVATNTAQEIMPMAEDDIETYYRLYNGKVQYRRWNATKNKWVDPYWIDMP